MMIPHPTRKERCRVTVEGSYYYGSIHTPQFSCIVHAVVHTKNYSVVFPPDLKSTMLHITVHPTQNIHSQDMSKTASKSMAIESEIHGRNPRVCF